ncbi:Cro/CI family transcriptional regulator [Nitrosospira briensis]|uniref:Cro/CI family transcriptional regulator n=1 Tax=Nitrosospira briensis TaxID=35799 RepID=UPI0004683B33|nr:Cro/CI family transcriptional regulator [Nitrosospira briensis]
MKTTFAISLFGSVAELAAALGITVQAVYLWGDEVPKLRQYEIRELRPEAFIKARDLVDDLIELAEEGEVYFDKTRYQYSLDDIEKSAVKAHPEFSAFMATTLAMGKAAL